MNTLRDPLPSLYPQDTGDTAAMRRLWHVAAVSLALSLAWIVLGYWRTGASMVAIWARSDTFAHGFLVAPISIWLVWRMRHRLLSTAPRPTWWGLAALAASGAAWLLGELGAVNAVSQFALVAMLVLAVVTVTGVRVAGRIAFPLAFLFFAVPVGEVLMPKLMEWTADVTVFALRFTGIPVYREGQNFVIPSGTWSVVEACSGVRYLIASVVIGTLYAYLTYESAFRRAVFVAFSIGVPIIANWMRAYIIVMLGHLSGNRLAVGVDHLIYGWLFFGIVILLMFSIGARWREDNVQPNATAAVATPAQPATSPAEFLLAAVMVIVVSTVWPLGSRLIERGDVASLPLLQAPPSMDGWSARDGGLSSWKPHYTNPSAQIHETFRKGDAQVGLFVGYYRNQSFDQKLVSSDNVLLRNDDPAWIRVSESSRLVDVAGQRVNVRVAELRGSTNDHFVVWSWYWIDGRLTASDVLAKGYTALARLMGRGDDSAVVVLYAKKGRVDEADATLSAFVQEAGPSLEAMLAATRSRR